MAAIPEDRLEHFHRRAVEQMRRVGLSAYILKEDGCVVRITPDGKTELIVVRLGLRNAQSGECEALRTQ
jgi:hypothetical protein